ASASVRGSVAAPTQSPRHGRKLPRQPANENYGAKLRDRLGQINPPPPSRSRRVAATAQFARHHLLRFFLLPRQQAANKLRPFLSIVFDCPFSKELADLRNTPLFLIRYFFNLPFQFWMDSKCQEIFLRHPANIAGQLRQKQ